MQITTIPPNGDICLLPGNNIHNFNYDWQFERRETALVFQACDGWWHKWNVNMAKWTNSSLEELRCACAFYRRIWHHIDPQKAVIIQRQRGSSSSLWFSLGDEETWRMIMPEMMPSFFRRNGIYCFLRASVTKMTWFGWKNSFPHFFYNGEYYFRWIVEGVSRIFLFYTTL